MAGLMSIFGPVILSMPGVTSKKPSEAILMAFLIWVLEERLSNYPLLSEPIGIKEIEIQN